MGNRVIGLAIALTQLPDYPISRLRRGFFLSEAFDRLVEDGIGCRRRLPELDGVRLVDGDGRLEAFFVQRRAQGREVAGCREPQARAVRQAHGPPRCGAADRVPADEV